MKDRNGKTLRDGDVCVVHNSPKLRDKTPEDFVGELCEIKRLFDTRVPTCCYVTITKYEWSRVLYKSELEIIGDVR